MRELNSNISALSSKVIREHQAMLDADKAVETADKASMPDLIKGDRYSGLWLRDREEWQRQKVASMDWAEEQRCAANQAVLASDYYLCVMYDKVSADSSLKFM